MINSILKTEQLAHRYTNAAWAIRDINLNIDRKGIVGLLGSNGAGKSTTMNIICGALNQTAGEVFVNGINLQKYPEEAKKNIGFLPQNPPLYQDLTVNEYLTYCAQLRMVKGGEVKRAVENSKERCNIGHIGDRLIGNLSGGYKQRVGIAQAIIHKPKLIVMDEPTNGLDPNQLIEVRKLIREIAEEHSVLLSSHILSEVQLLCKEIIMIESGRVVFSDSMDAFNNYVQPHSILMHMDNPPLEENLLALAGVNRIEFLSDKQVRVYFDGEEDICEMLIAESIRQSWRLKEISLDKVLLDDTFKYLSQSI